MFRAGKKMLYPLAVNVITSPFGNRKHPITGLMTFHNGIDLAAKIGTVVACPADGIVTAVTYNSTGGNQLSIKHDNGFTTGYLHLSRYAVKLNDRVKQSQIIAYTGATGNVTGPHLHLILKDASGKYLNPADYLI